jgi:hypothetical protein
MALFTGTTDKSGKQIKLFLQLPGILPLLKNEADPMKPELGRKSILF